MRTPAGKECPHYFEDYHRGRNVQECRLLEGNPASLRWRPGDCVRCPVPGIRAANASRSLELTLTIKPRLLGLGRTLIVTASCSLHRVEVPDPFVGCPECARDRDGLELFRKALEDNE